MNWLSIKGKVNISKDELKYIPSIPQDVEFAGKPTVAIVKSNVQFENGEISFDILLKDPFAQCHLILNGDTDTQILAGLNTGEYLYGIRILENGQYKDVSTAGIGDSIKPNNWYSVKVSVKGSLIKLYVENILVAKADIRVVKSQLAFFFNAKSEVIIKNIGIIPKKSKAFVVMQFTDEYDTLYKEVIKPTCEEYDFDCIRADDEYKSGLIIEDIVRLIEESSVIIADITPNNPNVFYEVGYAHGLSKPTILLSDKKREVLPFDISGFRTLFYDNTIGGKRLVEERLKKHLDNIV
ncbi:TIR domain-containing protein [Candidatus Magnetomoraceae bacterium gMMP-15]